MLLNCGFGEDSWESLGLQGDPTSPFWRRSVLGFLWKEWCWSWNSNTLATSCEELTHWKRLWCWEGLGAGRKGDDRGWDGCMASPSRWTWVWVNSGSWWWTGRPGVLQFMGSQRVEHDWATELNWTDVHIQQLLSWSTRTNSTGVYFFPLSCILFFRNADAISTYCRSFFWDHESKSHVKMWTIKKTEEAWNFFGSFKNHHINPRLPRSGVLLWRKKYYLFKPWQLSFF